MEGWSTFEPDSGMLINTPASLSFQSSPMAVLSLEVTNGALGFQMFFSQDCCQGCRPLPDRYTSTALWRSEVVKQQLSLSLSLALSLSLSVSSTLAWRIPWREEPGRLQSIGSQRVGHDFTFTFIYISQFQRCKI